jgi:hypothetical protein
VNPRRRKPAKRESQNNPVKASPNVISDYDPFAEYEREEAGLSRLDSGNIPVSDYDPIKKFEHEYEREIEGQSRPPSRKPTPKRKRRKANQASRAGAPEEHDWEEGKLFVMQELKTRGNPLDKNNQTKGWKTITDVAKLVIDHLVKLSKEEGYEGPDLSTARGRVADWIEEFKSKRN